MLDARLFSNLLLHTSRGLNVGCYTYTHNDCDLYNDLMQIHVTSRLEVYPDENSLIQE